MHLYENSEFVSVCLSVHLFVCQRNHPSFVNISPTKVINTSVERSLRVLQHENPNIWFSFQKKKGRNWILTFILTCAEVLKSPWLRQYQSYSSNWYMIGELFTSTTAWEPKKKNFFFFLNAYLSVSAVMFCEQFLAYTVQLIGAIMLSINIQVGLNMYLR